MEITQDLQEKIIKINENLDTLHFIEWYVFPIIGIICVYLLYMLFEDKEDKESMRTGYYFLIGFIISVIGIYYFTDHEKKTKISEGKTLISEMALLDKRLKGKVITNREVLPGNIYMISIMTDQGKWKGEVSKSIYAKFDVGDTVR